MTKRIDTAVILAAGRGTRLRPYTHDIPKGFMQIGDEKLVERSVRLLKQQGITHIIIGTGHLNEHYKTFADKEGLKTYISPEYATTGSFHTLCFGRELIQRDFLLLESDLLYDERAISDVLGHPASDVILCSGFTHSNDEVYVSEQNGLLKNLSKKSEELESVDAELVGIWKISYELYQNLLAHHEQAPDALSKDYEKAVAHLAGNGYPVHLLKIEDLIWCEIDSEEHLERAHQQILPKLLDSHQ